MAGTNDPRIVRLTSNEMQVVASLLGTAGLTGEERIRESELARSSYRIARQRLLNEGVVCHRYLPSLTTFGISKVSLLALRPYTDKIGTVSLTLSEEPGAVVVLSGSQIVFATVMHGSAAIARGFSGRVASGEFGHALAHVMAEPGSTSIPVYFDFEGVWSRLREETGTAGYPRAIPSGRAPTFQLRGLFGSRTAVMRSLLLRPFGGDDGRRPAHLSGPEGLPRSQKRLLEHGLAEWRTFLSLSILPEFNGTQVSHLVIAKGSPRGKGGMGGLLSDLMNECGIHPLLLAGDADIVLMLTLGSSDSDEGEIPSTQYGNDALQVVTRHLDRLEVIREPLSSLNAPLWHRYDRLAPFLT